MGGVKTWYWLGGKGKSPFRRQLAAVGGERLASKNIRTGVKETESGAPWRCMGASCVWGG